MIRFDLIAARTFPSSGITSFHKPQVKKKQALVGHPRTFFFSFFLFILRVDIDVKKKKRVLSRREDELELFSLVAFFWSRLSIVLRIWQCCDGSIQMDRLMLMMDGWMDWCDGTTRRSGMLVLDQLFLFYKKIQFRVTKNLKGWGRKYFSILHYEKSRVEKKQK